jgi:hypothetical protein
MLMLGLETTDQEIPSQDSMRVSSLLDAFGDEPTATQWLVAVQEIPPRDPPSAPGVGLGRTDHAPPLQDSISV